MATSKVFKTCEVEAPHNYDEIVKKFSPMRRRLCDVRVTEKPAAFMGEDICLRYEHRGRPVTAAIVGTADLIYHLPLHGLEMNAFLSMYHSDFFEKLYERLEKHVGIVKLLDILNGYLQTSQFKRGSFEYYQDQVFGTRRRRDAFKEYLERFFTTPGFELIDVSDSDSMPVAESLTNHFEYKSVTGSNPRYTSKDIREASRTAKVFLVACAREAMTSWPIAKQKAFERWFPKKMNNKHMELTKDYGFDYWAYHESELCFKLILAWHNDQRRTRNKEIAQAESAGEQATVVQEENTTFTDQRETVQEEGYITTQTHPTLQGFSMPEEEWHVKNIMSKPIPFYNGLWTTTEPTGKIVKYWSLPGDTLQGPHYNLTSTFTYFRGSPTVRIQVNGTKFHSGRLIFAFIPYYDNQVSDNYLYSVDNFTSFPHVILDASIANSGVIKLPFVHQNTYFNTAVGRQWQSLGVLVCAVYNKLQAATTSTQSIGITGWISYDQCELHQPCSAHDVALPKYAPKVYMTPVAESLVEGALKAALPMVKDLITPAMTSFGDVLGGASDQDKPTDPIEIVRWVPNTVSGLSKGDGIDRSDRLCLVPGYTIPDADLISTTNDDMDLLEVAKIPTRVQTIKWKSDNPSGSRLMALPVHPNINSSRTLNKDIVPPLEILTPTLLGYVARGFRYWRGGIRYKVQLIASQMHTGRLMFSFGAGLDKSKNFSEASYLNTITIDLQEQHEVEFIVPFMAERPWLRSDIGYYMNQPDSVAQYDTNNFAWTGYLEAHVLNALARPDSVASEIEVNILVSAADDFELAFPTDFACYQGDGNVIPKTLAEEQKAEIAQAESLENQDTVTTRNDSTTMTLGKGSGRLTAIGPKTMGENAMNLKTLLRRYTKVFHNKGEIGKGNRQISFVNTPCLSSVNKCYNNMVGRQYRTTLAHYSELYTFWRGSLRYKFVYKLAAKDANTIVPGITLRVFHIPGAFDIGDSTPEQKKNDPALWIGAFECYGTQLGVSDLQGSFEFEVPFYTPYTQLKTQIVGKYTARNATGTVCIMTDTPLDLDNIYMQYDLYQSAGDDFSLNYLRAPVITQWVNATETERSPRDMSKWPVPVTPVVCYKTSAAQDSELPKAEGISDYIPGVSHVKNAIGNMNMAADKTGQVCDTANHLLIQAAKKLGFEALTAEEDEEGATTIYEDASNAFEKMSSPVMTITECLINALKGLPEKFTRFLKPDLTTMDIFVEISNLISGLTAFIHGNTFVQKVCAVVTIVSTIVKDITTSIRNQLYRYASTVLDYFINGSEQGNGLPNAETLTFDVVAPLAASMVVGLGIVGLKKIPTDKETMDMCKGMSEKLRLFNFASLAATNLTKLWTEVKELTQYCMDWILGKFQPQILAQLKLDREFDQIEEWTRFLDSLDNIPFTDKIHYDLDFRNKIYKAIDLGNKYNNLIVTGKCGRAASVIRQYCMKALEVGVKCENSKNELPFRVDPFCVCMVGGSNIGKSGCITTLGYDVMDELGFPLHNRWCAVNCNETFFTENYRQQSAVYFDDFSTFTTEEQYKTFMNLKANTKLPLNMAFRKGEYFNSPLIYMTTNTAYPNPNFVTHHDALLRRRDVLVEADWADKPEIEAALNNHENMMRHRQLDNSHLKFRIKSSTDSRAPPGAWMTYEELKQTLVAETKAHLENQQRKLTNDLTRAGYILPEAEAEVGDAEQPATAGTSGPSTPKVTKLERKLCLQACINSPSLKLFDPEMWQHVTWDFEEQRFDIYLDTTGDADSEYFRAEWTRFKSFHKSLLLDEQDALRNNSYIVKEKATFSCTIKAKLSEFHDWLSKKIIQIGEEHPWLAVVAKWGIYASAAIAAASIAFKFTKHVVHKCACSAIRYFGFRCGLCGKWPALKNVTARLQAWMLREWSKLYANEDYHDGHVTTIQEEQALRAVTGSNEQTTTYELGTRNKAVAEGVYSDVTKGHGPVRVVAQSGQYSQDVRGQAAVKVTAEGGQAREADTMIQNRILPYIYRFKTRGGVGISTQQMNGFAIGDRKMLLNSHFFVGLKDGDIFECYHNGAWICIEHHEEACIRVPNKDLVIFEMPKSFHQHRNNIIHFISENDLPRVQCVVGSLCKLTTGLDNLIVENLKIKPMKQLRFQQTTAGGTETYYVQDAWKYAKCSSYGDCGSPLVCTSGYGSGKVLGIHVASTSDESYSQLVTQEMLQGLLKSNLGTPLPKAEARLSNRIPQGHLGRIGCAGPKEMMIQNDKTQIIPTEIHGMVAEPVTFPTVLSKRDERLTQRVDPMVRGIAKYAGVGVPFPKRHRDIVNTMMNEEVKNLHLVRPNPEPTTWKQACFGDEMINGFERLPKNTSPGYPWIKSRPVGELGKTYLFDLENQTMTAKLEKAVLDRECLAQRNERVLSIWVDCLKDERRSLEKIQSGSTRLFTVPPVDFSIVMRKYTMDFCAAVWNSRDDHDCKVGIDPQSLEWTTLYRWLSEFSPLCVAGDFTGFDGSMPADIIDDVRGDIDAFYAYHGNCSAEDMNVRKVLFEEMIHTVHLARDEFYMTHIGNKSGNPITVILNSRVNKRYMALAWLGIAEEKGLTDMANMAKFTNNVRCAIYGDDNILAIKPEVVDWFNQETISVYLENFNIIYTNEQKTGITRYKTLDECTFLKQSFKDHESIKMIKTPHMAMKTILELTNWTRIAPDQDELLKDNCNDALRFMYFYGKSAFDDLRNKIQKALLDKEKRFYLYTYMDYHLWFLDVIGATNDFKISK